MSTISDAGAVRLTALEWKRLTGRVPLLVDTPVWSVDCDNPMAPQVTGGGRAVYWCCQSCGRHTVDMAELDEQVWRGLVDHGVPLPPAMVDERWPRCLVVQYIARVTVTVDGTPTIEWNRLSDRCRTRPIPDNHGSGGDPPRHSFRQLIQTIHSDHP